MRISPKWLQARDLERRAFGWEVAQRGIDWITATAKTPDKASALFGVADVVVQFEHDQGNLPRPWQWQGYRGITCGQIAYGGRADGAIIRMSGEAASAHWQSAVAVASNVSRLDLQVTATASQSALALATSYYRDHLRMLRGTGQPSRATLLVSEGHGDTLYLGSRSSAVYCRCYDKHKESEGEWPANTWRWEVELKEAQAMTVAGLLASDVRPERCAQGLVFDYFARRNCLPCWEKESPCSYRPSPEEPSDVARLLAWLKSTVAPALDKLQAHVDGETLAQALGWWGPYSFNEPSALEASTLNPIEHDESGVEVP